MNNYKTAVYVHTPSNSLHHHTHISSPQAHINFQELHHPRIKPKPIQQNLTATKMAFKFAPEEIRDLLKVIENPQNPEAVSSALSRLHALSLKYRIPALTTHVESTCAAHIASPVFKTGSTASRDVARIAEDAFRAAAQAERARNLTPDSFALAPAEIRSALEKYTALLPPTSARASDAVDNMICALDRLAGKHRIPELTLFAELAALRAMQEPCRKSGTGPVVRIAEAAAAKGLVYVNETMAMKEGKVAALREAMLEMMEEEEGGKVILEMATEILFGGK